MRRQYLLLALLVLMIAIGVAYLVGRQSQMTSLSAGGSSDGSGSTSSKARASAEAQLERSERQSLLFSRRLGELEQELEAANTALRTAVKTVPPSAAQDGVRLAAIEAGLHGALQVLQEVGRTQAEQGTNAKIAQGDLLKLFGELREIASKPAENVDGLDALALKITALEAASGKTAGEIGTMAQSVTKLSESLEKFLKDQVESGATREGEISKLANEIGRFHETISRASSDLKSFRDELVNGERRSVGPATRVPAPVEIGIANVFKGETGVSAKTSDTTARRPIAAEIRAIDRLKDVVILNKGKAHGLEKDDLFEITRLGRSIGKVRVIRLWDTYAGAEVVDVLPGETLENGDVVRNYVGGRPHGATPKSVDADSDSDAGSRKDAGASTKTPAKSVISGAPEKRSPPPPPPGN
jgi:HAMP domain-containing protein